MVDATEEGGTEQAAEGWPHTPAIGRLMKISMLLHMRKKEGAVRNRPTLNGHKKKKAKQWRPEGGAEKE